MQTQRRYVATLYLAYIWSSAAIAAPWAVQLLVASHGRVARLEALALGVTGVRLAWVSLRVGVWLDSGEQTVTCRGVLMASRVPRSDVAEIVIESQKGLWPRGFLIGARRVPLRGMGVRHAHRLRFGAMNCRYCDRQRQAMNDLASALHVPVVEGG